MTNKTTAITERVGRLTRTLPWRVADETVATLRAERVPRLGAGLAYYGLFALVPLLAIAIAIAGLVFENAQVSEALTARLAELLGQEVDSAAVVDQAADFVDDGSTQFGFGLVGLMSLLLGGSVFFLAYQDALNVIFRQPPRSGLKFSFRRRLRASLVVLLTGTVIVTMLVAQALIGLINALLPSLIEGSDVVVGSLGLVASAALGALLLTILVRTLVYEPIHWRSALVAQSITAVCLGIGAFGFGVYMDRIGGRSLQGATAGVFVTILFIYVEAQILLAGGALTKALESERLAGNAGAQGDTDGES